MKLLLPLFVLLGSFTLAAAVHPTPLEKADTEAMWILDDEGFRQWKEADQECRRCLGIGEAECEGCKGKRYVGVVKVGRGPGEAKVPQLEKARETLTESLRPVKASRPTGNESWHRRAFFGTFDDGKRALPALKNMERMAETGLNALRGSAMYVEYEGMVADEFESFRNRTVTYQESQLALIDICLERLEFNQKVKDSE